MNWENLSTREKILLAATDLIADNGYKGTTTKCIAAVAGVSEMTVFRHFGSKKAILAAIMAMHSFEYPIENELRDQLTGELEADLFRIAQMQYRFNVQNEKTMLIKFREGKNLVAFHIDVVESPTKLKEFLVDFFNRMYLKGKIIQSDNERLAIYFMSISLGLFCDKLLSVYGKVTNITKDEELAYSVRLFAKALRP